MSNKYNYQKLGKLFLLYIYFVLISDAEKKMKKTMWGQFWSSHQRFFKYLCIASKVRCISRFVPFFVQCFGFGIRFGFISISKEIYKN
jgi:hypothetical protein